MVLMSVLIFFLSESRYLVEVLGGILEYSIDGEVVGDLEVLVCREGYVVDRKTVSFGEFCVGRIVVNYCFVDVIGVVGDESNCEAVLDVRNLEYYVVYVVFRFSDLFGVGDEDFGLVSVFEEFGV